MSLRWQDIKTFNNSQNSAFEELVCQLAREEDINGKKEFYRVAAPDGGVEAYCILENGDEYGWQAKYFSSMGTSQWSDLKESFEHTLRTHPKLKKYFICIPLDRADPRDKKKWFMNQWNEKVITWTNYAKAQGIDISFEYWGSSELVHRLSQEKHAGRKLFWFSQEDFSNGWFESHINTSIHNLGKRYTTKLNFELDIAKNFDAISKNDAFRQQVKDNFHTLLLKVNQACSRLPELLLRDKIQSAVSNIKYLFSVTQKTEIIQIDTNSLEASVNLIKEVFTQYYRQVDKEEKKDSNDSRKYQINLALNAASEFIEFIQSSILKLANLPIILLSGDAGIGKSHLLGDIASSRIKSNKSCILLLGQHFTSDESPWTQILRNLLRLGCNEKELLGALNAKAEAQGERLLFIVDAINEGRGKYFWTDHISGFIHDFSNYPWIGLVLSIRSSYENLITPEDFISANKVIKIKHLGFDGVEYQASSFFFAQYGIEQPTIPLLNPEFSNPLFLKLFCEGLNQAGLSIIPKGYGGISSIIEFFIESIDKKLSHPLLFDYPSGIKIIRRVIDLLIKHKLESSNKFIPYEDACEIADNLLSKFSSKRRFLDALISEGVLSKNLFWRDGDEYEEGIYLAYERFEDHFTTSYLLDRDLNEDTLETIFRKDGKLYSYVDYSYQGILESLSIQIPERTGKELYELIDEEQKPYLSLIEAFVYSLIWRKVETINDKTLKYVNDYVLRNGRTFNSFFQMVYSVSSNPNHLYNADRLHIFLMQFSLAVRDAIWTKYLHSQYYEQTSMLRLINWARSQENKSYLSTTSRLLSAKALAWLLTTTNIAFRDSATKALVVLLENHISIITELLLAFKDVNDPYIVERIFAAAYGAVLRSEKLDGLKELSDHIVESIFQAEEVYLNVLVRDYARNIVEYAQYKKYINLPDIAIIRPPYRSSFPSSFPSNEEIDAYKFDYSSAEFKDHFWGQNSILSSMVTEYGRGMCSYGDFGRYTFQSALSDWEDFDPNDLSNYACKLIFEKYGYDVEKHGKFDRHATTGDRHINQTERIGKKYQWIALYEVLARISDNHKMNDESIWGEEKQFIWYQGPWSSYIRNIDPTIIYSQSKDVSNSLGLPSDLKYEDWSGSDSSWLIGDRNLPRPEDMIAFNTHDNDEWLSLENHLSWDEPVPIGHDTNLSYKKNLWYQIRSYLVKDDEAVKLVNWLKNQHFMGRWLPEAPDRHQVFSREYYWSPAYRFLDNPYFGGYNWEKVYEHEDRRKAIARVLPTAERHTWESGSEYENQPSYLAPRECMFLDMGLQYSKNIGEWLDRDGQVVCVDPSVRNGGNSMLIIKKKPLQDFLKRNKLKIFWTCLGEKIIHGQLSGGKQFSQWLELSGVYTLNNGRIKGELRSILNSPQ